MTLMGFTLLLPTALAPQITKSEGMILYVVGLTWVPVWLLCRVRLNEWVVAGMWLVPLVWLYGSYQGLYAQVLDASLHAIGSLVLIIVFMQIAVMQEIQGIKTGLYAWLTAFGLLPSILMVFSFLLMLEVPDFGLVMILILCKVFTLLIWAVTNSIWDRVRDRDEAGRVR